MTTSTYRSGADTLALLRSLAAVDPVTGRDLRVDKRVLTGQHLPNWQSGSDSLADYVRGQALLGTTVITGADDDYTYQPDIAVRLCDHLGGGGVALLDLHPANPKAPAGRRNIATAWLSSGVGRPALASLLRSAPGSTVRSAWWDQVDRLVTFLAKLPRGSAVILRPFHEANGSYFWWGYNPSSSASRADQSALLVQLTTDVRDYVDQALFQRAVDVDTLWAHTGNALDWDTDIAYGRPGWVDIVGCSLYSDTLTMLNRYTDTYANLVATGKPVILAEVGPDVNKTQLGTWDTTTIIRKIRASWPKVVAWQGWQENDGQHLLAPVQNRNWQTLLTDPWSIQLTDLATITPPTAGKYAAVHLLGTYATAEAAKAAYPNELVVPVTW